MADWTPSDNFLSGWSAGETKDPNIGFHYGPNDPQGRTAFGAYGITQGTYNGIAKNHPELNLPSWPPTDLGVQKTAFSTLSTDNAKALAAAGVPSNDATVALAGMFGAPTAIKLLSADPDAPAETVLSPEAIAQNGNLFKGKTVGQLIMQNGATHNNGAAAPTAQPGAFGQQLPPPNLPDLAPHGPSPTAQVAPPNPSMTGLGLGLSIMSGAKAFEGLKNASDYITKSQQQALDLNKDNANFQDKGYDRDNKTDLKGIDYAMRRAELQQLYGYHGASLSLEAQKLAQDGANQRAQIQHYNNEDAEKKRQFDEGNRQSIPMVDYGEDGTQTPVYGTMMIGKNSTVTTVGPDGKPMSQWAQPLQSATHPDAVTVANIKANTPLITKMGQDAQAARTQDQRYSAAMDALNNPNANTQAGILGNVGRALDATFGTSVFGSLKDTTIADGLLKQDMLGQFGNASKGGARVTDSLRGFIQTANPHLGQDPDAIRGITGFLQNQNQMPIRINDEWNKLSKVQQNAIVRTDNIAQWQDRTRKALSEQDAADLDRARQNLEQKYGPGGNGGAKNGTGSFWGTPAPAPAAGAPAPGPTAPGPVPGPAGVPSGPVAPPPAPGMVTPTSAPAPAGAPTPTPAPVAPAPLPPPPLGGNSSLYNPASPQAQVPAGTGTLGNLKVQGYTPPDIHSNAPDLSKWSKPQLADILAHPDRYPGVPVWAARAALEDRD